MEEKDKILLSAYLDNDLSQEEVSYVENLLKKPEAQAYLNNLKKVNIEVGNYFKKSLSTDVAKDALRNLEMLKKEKGLIKKIITFISGKLFLTNLATASFALFSLLAIPNLLKLTDKSLEGVYGLSDFDTNSIMEFEVTKTRGIRDPEFDSKIKEFLGIMVDQKKANASLKYGDESLLLSISKEVLVDDEQSLKCFNVVIYSLEKDEILFCKSNKETSVLYID